MIECSWTRGDFIFLGSSLWNTGCLLVQILSDLPQSSLHLTQCLLSEGNDSHVDPHQRLVNVLFRCETWKDMALHVGAVVKIHPPWYISQSVNTDSSCSVISVAHS